jgi:hypothetical protein
MLYENDPAQTPEVRDAERTVDTLVALADAYQVTTVAAYEAGADDLKQIKAAQKHLEDLRTGMTGPLNASLKRINEFFRAPTLRLQTAEGKIKRSLLAYQQEQERIRREHQAKLDAEARQKRERLEAQAREAERKAREKAEAERRAADAAAAAGRADEAATLAAKAAATEAKAAEKAEDLQTRAAMVVAPVVQAERPKVVGVSTREVWHGECADLLALVRAIADGKAPLSLVIANDKLIGQQARALKHDFTVPGIRVWATQEMASRSAG